MNVLKLTQKKYRSLVEQKVLWLSYNLKITIQLLIPCIIYKYINSCSCNRYSSKLFSWQVNINLIKDTSITLVEFKRNYSLDIKMVLVLLH